MSDNSTMIKILEYMAYQVRIVRFDLKEGRRVAGPAAPYESANDPIDFAHRATSLLDSENLRREIKECDRRGIENGLNWEVKKAVLLKAYERALE
jgi:glycosyltransferase involved in cell wall biosynthesis